MTTVVLHSQIDSSINRVRQVDLTGKEKIETRIVQRNEDTLILYISSHMGCLQACRFCWLTQTKQTNQTFITKEGYKDQIEWIIEQLKDDPRINKVSAIHINLMARGDSLTSPFFVLGFKGLRVYIQNKLASFFPNAIQIKYKISSIFPKDMVMSTTSEVPLQKWIEYDCDTGIFGEVEFYYSLYTLNPHFRNRWLPKAMDPEYVGSVFRGHRPQGNMSQFRLHHALIEGENTNDSDVQSIHDWLERHDIHCFLNLVHYNPYDESCGTEASEETTNNYIELMKQSPRITGIQRVNLRGPDVKASCGMFVEGNLISV